MKNLIPDKQLDPFNSDDSSSSIQASLNPEASDDNQLEFLSENENEQSEVEVSDADFSVDELDEDESDFSYQSDDYSESSEAESKSEMINGEHENDEDKKKSSFQNEDGTKDSRDDDSDSESSESEELEASMEDIFGVKPNKEAEKNHPPKITAASPVLDICFHPETEILAAGNICGECILYRYSLEKVDEIKRLNHHDSSCRQVCFNCNGSLLYTVSNDKSLAIVDVEKSAVKKQFKSAHETAIYSFTEINQNLLATGDDDGTVKLWDTRLQDPVMEYKCSEETITSLLSCENSKFLSATCGDGSLTGFNIRKKKMETQSEMFDSEFTCQSLVRSESKLVIGSGSGIFYIFNWGEFGYNIDALSGHPDQIQCQAAITDKIVISGCNDGIIRATHLYPHRFLGIVGQHKDFSIDNLSVSYDGFLLATCSSDDFIQFWNIEYLYNKKINPKKKSNKKMAVKKHLQSSRTQNKKDFFRDLPKKMESDDEHLGPVPGTSYDSD